MILISYQNINQKSFFRFYFNNLLSNFWKYFIDALTRFSWSIHLYYLLCIYIQTIFQRYQFLLCNLPLGWISITLISSQGNHKFIHIIFFIHFFRPIAYAIKSPLIRQIITNNSRQSIPIIHTHQTSKPIWTPSIPYMQFHNCPIFWSYILLHVGTTYCHIITFTKWILAISLRYTRFSYAWIS